MFASSKKHAGRNKYNIILKEGYILLIFVNIKVYTLKSKSIYFPILVNGKVRTLQNRSIYFVITVNGKVRTLKNQSIYF